MTDYVSVTYCMVGAVAPRVGGLQSTSTGRTWFEPVDSVHPTMVGGCWTDPTPSAFDLQECSSRWDEGNRVWGEGAGANMLCQFVAISSLL